MKEALQSGRRYIPLLKDGSHAWSGFVRKFMVLLLLGFPFSFPVVAGDSGIKLSAFGGVVSSTLAVTFCPADLTDNSKQSTQESGKKGDRKILSARDDAAAFVASDGYIRAVGLETAFEVLRIQAVARTASEMELAHAIMVYQGREAL